MSSAVELRGSCSPLSAIALALVALGIAACSADVTRLGDGAVQTSQVSGSVSPASSAGVTFGPGATALARPKADLAGGRPAEVSTAKTVAGLAAPKAHPTKISHARRKLTVAAARSTTHAARNVANRGRGDLLARRSLRQRTHEPAERQAADTRATDARPIFDWPVHGKIVERFGRQSNGERNDGITIAVPQDTPIRSADDGVVIYAGSGLKKFGNLVLVRHANGYVTTYAHARELDVKRDDQIKRGEVIGKSGQTGGVTTPQLYFEIRKDSAPLDPLPLLQGKSEPAAAKDAANAR
jgi:murein DD-endopeptidase MepM/ murein hydrolase activator NlpD